MKAWQRHAGREPAEERRKRLGISEGLVRISTGIEDFVDIRDDIDQALTSSLRP